MCVTVFLSAHYYCPDLNSLTQLTIVNSPVLKHLVKKREGRTNHIFCCYYLIEESQNIDEFKNCSNSQYYFFLLLPLMYKPLIHSTLSSLVPLSGKRAVLPRGQAN